MRLLITGACGFVGSSLAIYLQTHLSDIEITGLDNFSRPGSEMNRTRLRAAGIRVVHGDVRCESDLHGIPPTDWVIDAAANASVLAGVDGETSPRQLFEQNLLGTINTLEYCRRHGAGLILLSSSRVYSLTALRRVPLDACPDGFRLADGAAERGLTWAGISESYPVGAPATLYGTSKFASEQLALEYSGTYGFPVWVNRCGVMSGAGQFGQPAQGIFAWWIHRWFQRKPLKYIGFGGRGLQVRDCLHPVDLAGLIAMQLGDSGAADATRVFNVSGGTPNACSLAQLSTWCESHLGPHTVTADAADRVNDVPWLVLDSQEVSHRWGWKVSYSLERIFSELASHAQEHPEWLTLSEG